MKWINRVSCPLSATVRRWMRALVITVGVLALLYGVFYVAYPPLFRMYTGDKTGKMTYPNQDTLTDAEFEVVAKDLEQTYTSMDVQDEVKNVSNPLWKKEKARLLSNLASTKRKARFPHIDYFRKAGIRTYEGPKTCLQCHEEMKVQHPDGTVETVKTIDNVMNSVHFRLFSDQKNSFSTYGYDGTLVDSENRTIPVGKIDRACGVPGSFTWTGWAALIHAKPDSGEPEVRSEGCGQCHIGGGYGPPSMEMMPVKRRTHNEIDGIDCLICHSRSYDMNQRYVLEDSVGTRWNEDRSMRAAMTVGKPTEEGCLTCHQHNLGGDSYPFNDASKHPGYHHQRLLHGAAKRGTPFTPDADVHAAAGMTCLDCHTSVGHKIARGTKGVDLVSNDLPDVDVSCVGCHTSSPHVANTEVRAILNGHTARIACETCHITKLWEDNLVLVDWLQPTWNPEEGIYQPKAVYQTGDMSKAVEYLWFNGNGSFLANALGSNPTGGEDYDPLMQQMTRYDKVPGMNIPGLSGVDFLEPLSPELLQQRKEMLARGLLPVSQQGQSKIYPFKLFNARMYEDMNNQGPFGAMLMPFDYPVYYETGDAYASMEKALQNPMIRRMYQKPFKYYMMDRFMQYFGVDGWATKYPLEKANRDSLQGHWMRQMGTLMINHAITKEGRTCEECHRPNGLLDFAALGYSPERVKDLENLPELKKMKAMGVQLPQTDVHRPKEITRKQLADLRKH